MDVRELSKNQLHELKCKVYFSTFEEVEEEFADVLDDEIVIEFERAQWPDDISDETIYKLFGHFDFVDDDFCCSCGFDNINGFRIEYGYSLEEYRELWGDMYDEGELWDFSFTDVVHGAIEPNPNMIYWAIVIYNF